MTAPAAVAPTGVKHRALILVSIMAATLMQTLDTTIANVALPKMQGSLSATQDQISWVLTSYIVASAIGTPLIGWLAGRFGRKRVLLLSVAGFTLASVLCGVATSLGQIVAYRLLQGLCGAALVPMSQAVMFDITPKEKYGSVMAIWGAAIMIGPILGPTLGGWLTEDYNWRWVFYINLPIGILAFLGVSVFLSETQMNLERPFDWFGFTVLSIAIGAAQMMLDRGQEQDWFGSTEIWIECGLAAAGFWIFIIHAATAKHPFVSLTLFTDRNFASGLMVMGALSILLFSTTALLPTMMQDLMDYPVLTAGNLLVPRGVGTMIAMLIVSRIANLIDTRAIMLFGLSLSAFALWQMTGFSLQMDLRIVLIAGVIQGIGMGFLFVPLSITTFTTLSPALRGEGTSLFNLMRNMGGSVGIAIVENVLARSIQVNHAALVAPVTPFNAAFRDPMVARVWDLHSTAGLTALNGEITRQAAMIAYVNDFKLMMIVSLLTMPLIALLRSPRAPPAIGAAASAHD
jgi:MFS transporter, DHA2 family, multidrug resistance protein